MIFTLRTKLLLITVGSILIGSLTCLAQSFSANNNRNHPENDWQVASTEHFNIVYPIHLSGIEIEAGTIAEATFQALSNNLAVVPKGKIQIYLSDEDEIINGFAFALGAYTCIWVSVNDALSLFTGETKWLRKVLAHELAHIFHYWAVKGERIGFVGSNVLGNPIPSFWTEGLAQYETEYWDAVRGDAVLRTAVLQDKIDYEDGSSVWNGRLKYAFGNSQVRYFVEQYGDSTLAKLLSHRKSVLLGLGKVHDFEEAFDAVVGISYPEFSNKWRRHVNMYYNTLAAYKEPLDSLMAQKLPSFGKYVYAYKVNPTNSLEKAMVVLPSLGRPVKRLILNNDGSTKILAEGNIDHRFSWNDAGTLIAFSKQSRATNGSLLNDIFLYDFKKDKVERLTFGERALMPQLITNEELLFVVNQGKTANIVSMNLKTGEIAPQTAFEGDIQISEFIFQKGTNSLLLTIHDTDSKRKLVQVSLGTKEIKTLFADGRDFKDLTLSVDGNKLGFVTLEDEVPNVFTLDLSDHISTQRITNLATGARLFDWLPSDSLFIEGKLVLRIGEDKSFDQLFEIDATRTANYETPIIPEQFTTWRKKQPPKWIPDSIVPNEFVILRREKYKALKNVSHFFSFGLPLFLDKSTWGITGITVWREPLDKHQFALYGFFNARNPLESNLNFAYINRQLEPTTFINLYQKIVAAPQFYQRQLIFDEMLGGDVGVKWEFNAPDYTNKSLLLKSGIRKRTPIEPKHGYISQSSLPLPAQATETYFQAIYQNKKVKPYAYNYLSSIDAKGIQVKLEARKSIAGTTYGYLEPSFRAYYTTKRIGFGNLYIYTAASAQFGESLSQHYLGHPYLDKFSISLPTMIDVPWNDQKISMGVSDRVRGYRNVHVGNRMIFATIAYRGAPRFSLNTSILGGMIQLGATSFAAFADAGVVWNQQQIESADSRFSYGLEARNGMKVFGLRMLHAFGIAQPYDDFGSTKHELYYRIQTSLPF